MGGLNVYAFVGNGAVSFIDVLGLWGEDFHFLVTLELAEKAGIACAEDVARNAYQPDRDKRSATRTFWAVTLRGWWHGNEWAERRLEEARRWHFPACPDGTVNPGSEAARAIVRQGIAECDFVMFSEGLHPLQDSWSHQGTPYYRGIGHSRGARRPRKFTWDRRYWIPLPSWPRGDTWEPKSGLRAAICDSADSLEAFPASARGAAMATYEKLIKFKEACPCHCPGGKTTSSGPHKCEIEVREWLRTERIRGEDVVQ